MARALGRREEGLAFVPLSEQLLQGDPAVSTGPAQARPWVSATAAAGGYQVSLWPPAFLSVVQGRGWGSCVETVPKSACLLLPDQSEISRVQQLMRCFPPSHPQTQLFKQVLHV